MPSTPIGTKRKPANVQDLRGTRKSRRIETGLTLGPMTVDRTCQQGADSVNRFMDRSYNLFCTFTKNVSPHGNAARSSTIVGERISRIQEIMDHAEAEIRKELDELVKEVNVFIDTFDEKEAWFLDGNILRGCSTLKSENEGMSSRH